MLKITEPIFSKEDDYNFMRFSTLGEHGYDFYFKTRAQISKNSNAAVCSCIIPAMKLGEKIEVGGYITPLFYLDIFTLQNAMAQKYKELTPVGISAKVLSNGLRKRRKVACFFTAGVDSFYTLMKNIDRIDTIVYVHGYDVWTYEKDYLKMVSDHIKEVARELGKELIEVETNIHSFGDKYVDWQCHYHGSALASVAHLLSEEIEFMYIASTFSYEELPLHDIAAAIDPQIDPLWGGDCVKIMHDGCEASRLDKIKALKDNKSAHKHLHVCLDRTKGLYNCSQCEKCLRTMVGIEAVGKLDDFEVFKKLEVSAIDKINIDFHTYPWWAQNYENLKEGEVKSAVGRLLERCKDLTKTYP